jgi:hypothetical protein
MAARPTGSLPCPSCYYDGPTRIRKIRVGLTSTRANNRVRGYLFLECGDQYKLINFDYLNFSLFESDCGRLQSVTDSRG